MERNKNRSSFDNSANHYTIKWIKLLEERKFFNLFLNFFPLLSCSLLFASVFFHSKVWQKNQGCCWSCYGKISRRSFSSYYDGGKIAFPWGNTSVALGRFNFFWTQDISCGHMLFWFQLSLLFSFVLSLPPNYREWLTLRLVLLYLLMKNNGKIFFLIIFYFYLSNSVIFCEILFSFLQEFWTN